MGVKLDKLVAINFPDRNKNAIPGNRSWHARQMITNTCSRNLMITSPDDWEKVVPDEVKQRCMTAEGAKEYVEAGGDAKCFTREDQPYFHMERGEKAYEMLLRIAVGLESTKRGEPEVHGQIMERWKAFKLEDAVQSTKIENPLTALLGDAKRIHGAIIKGRREPKLEGSAKALGEAHKGHVAVVIASDDIDETKRMVHALGKQHDDSVSDIVVLHRDEKKVAQLQHNFELMAEHNELQSSFKADVMTKDNLALAMDLADAVFVLPAQGTHPAADQEVIDAWKARSGAPAHAVILSARQTEEEGEHNASLDQWKTLPGVVLPEAVKERFEAKKVEFEDVLQQAENAVKNSISAHKANHQVVNEYLGLPPDEYTQRAASAHDAWSAARKQVAGRRSLVQSLKAASDLGMMDESVPPR